LTACFFTAKRIKKKTGRVSSMSRRDWRGYVRALAGVGALSLAMPAMLAGCSGFKQTIGLEPTPPDEFAVEARAPLTIPPDFDLRPPAPGKPRPQETTSAEAAERALQKAGPGKPGHQELPSDVPRLAGGLGGGPDPNNEVRNDSLSAKLLRYDGPSGSGVAVDQRKTTVLKDVY
jgi:DUF3035 family protein